MSKWDHISKCYVGKDQKGQIGKPHKFKSGISNGSQENKAK